MSRIRVEISSEDLGWMKRFFLRQPCGLSFRDGILISGECDTDPYRTDCSVCGVESLEIMRIIDHMYATQELVEVWTQEEIDAAKVRAKELMTVFEGGIDDVGQV